MHETTVDHTASAYSEVTKKDVENVLDARCPAPVASCRKNRSCCCSRFLVLQACCRFCVGVKSSLILPVEHFQEQVHTDDKA